MNMDILKHTYTSYLVFSIFLAIAHPLEAEDIIFDDFNGTTAGIAEGATFTPTTSVFTVDDGIKYNGSVFPPQGMAEVVLRIDDVGAQERVTPRTLDFSTILDTSGSGGRFEGDMFLAVGTDGKIKFTLTSPEGIGPTAQIRVTSETSVLDGAFHIISVCYGFPNGIRLYIDGVLEDTSYEPVSTIQRNTRPVTLGDVTESNDASYGFSFEGEVDSLRTSTDCNPSIPSPSSDFAVQIIPKAFSVSGLSGPFPGETYCCFADTTVNCPPETIIIGGGVKSDDVTDTQSGTNLTANADWQLSGSSPDGNGWRITGRNTGTPPLTLTAYALCAP